MTRGYAKHKPKVYKDNPRYIYLIDTSFPQDKTLEEYAAETGYRICNDVAARLDAYPTLQGVTIARDKKNESLQLAYRLLTFLPKYSDLEPETIEIDKSIDKLLDRELNYSRTLIILAERPVLNHIANQIYGKSNFQECKNFETFVDENNNHYFEAFIAQKISNKIPKFGEYDVQRDIFVERQNQKSYKS